MRSGVQDQPDQHSEAPSLLKIQKLDGCGGTCLKCQLLWWGSGAGAVLSLENHLNPKGRGCSERRSHHYPPAWATEQDSIRKQKTNNKTNKQKRLRFATSGFLEGRLKKVPATKKFTVTRAILEKSDPCYSFHLLSA